ncbi:MAG: hypothetical protein HC809_08875 [Gammaproteobacteria bacterium]|nr:hypothetical protein [Gammaproteobacteria bacterium]
MSGVVGAIEARLRDAIQAGDTVTVARLDDEVRTVVAQAISHDSAKAISVLEALREVYAGLLAMVSAERTRLNEELVGLSHARRGVTAYQAGRDA